MNTFSYTNTDLHCIQNLSEIFEYEQTTFSTVTSRKNSIHTHKQSDFPCYYIDRGKHKKISIYVLCVKNFRTFTKAVNDYFLKLLETKNPKQKLTTNTCTYCISICGNNVIFLIYQRLNIQIFQTRNKNKYVRHLSMRPHNLIHN